MAPRGRVKNLDALTSLRFFAALFVVVTHLAAVSGNLGVVELISQTGWLGVSFFFILSGFVLMWSFDQGIGPAAYVLRRLTRIYPLHFVCLVLSLLFFLQTGKALGGYVGTAPGTIANFLLIHSWIPGHPDIRQAWNGVSWTLSCEFFFYIMAPFCFPAFAGIGRGKYFLSVAALWLGLSGFVLLADSRNWHAALDFYIYNPLPRSYEFVLGAIGAQWVKAGFRFRSTISALAAMMLPVLLYCIAVPEPSRSSALMNLMFIPGAFLLIVATAGNEIDRGKSFLYRRGFVQLGEASFALYMTHAMLLGLFLIFIVLPLRHQFYTSLPLEVSLSVMFILVCVGVSILVHRFFEFPVRRKLLKILAGNTKFQAAGGAEMVEEKV